MVTENWFDIFQRKFNEYNFYSFIYLLFYCERIQYSLFFRKYFNIKFS